MGFRGSEFAFESPAAAVAALVARVTCNAETARGPRNAEGVTMDSAMGRILAETVSCDRDSPGFDYAAMDGYAVRAADVLAAAVSARVKGEGAITLAVAGECRIGATPPLLRGPARGAGTHAVALRIATGAAIPTGPDGADAIIKREDVVEHADETGTIGGGVRAVTLRLEAAERVAAGDYVRYRGENARTGDTVLAPGNVLAASSLGALAAVGCVMPRVFERLRVAVITTGDELVIADQTPGAYQVRNSNAASIAAILGSQAWIQVVRVSHLNDDADLAAALGAMAGPDIAAEAVILTGGVSMGHRDPVRAGLEAIGAEVVFHGLPQRPGKPMLAAVHHVGGGRIVPIVGLPGNPVSAMVTCTRIVLPVLAACAGAQSPPAALLPRLVHLANDDGKRIELWWHRPARLRIRDDGAPVAELVDTRGSGDIVSAARSDGFVELCPAPGNSAGAESRSLVPFYPWPA